MLPMHPRFGHHVVSSEENECTGRTAIERSSLARWQDKGSYEDFGYLLKWHRVRLVSIPPSSRTMLQMCQSKYYLGFGQIET
jgi:hypothetical protein